MAKSKRVTRSRKLSAHREPSLTDRFSKMVAPPELYSAAKRKKWKIGPRGPYVIELNLQHVEGLSGAATQLEYLLDKVVPNKKARAAIPLARTYYRCNMTVEEWKALLARDAAEAEKGAKPSNAAPLQFRAIYKLWPDFPVERTIYRSMPTIKADAALRSYEAAGEGIVWAVLDSGIDGTHPHFNTRATQRRSRCTGSARSAPMFRRRWPAKASRGFADRRRTRFQTPTKKTSARTNGARGSSCTATAALNDRVRPRHPRRRHHRRGCACRIQRQAARARSSASTGSPAEGNRARPSSHYASGLESDAKRFRGVAPRCKLVSLRVLDAKGAGRSSDIIRALDYVREKLNDNPKLLRVHGVNLSVGYEFDAEMFACGQSPICAEVNRLVQSGVVVVAAAGNTGYGTVGALVRADEGRPVEHHQRSRQCRLAITVGATHRDAPHTFGVSYFSSKGPTGDGRLKPDLVAPGERITSCAAGKRLDRSARRRREPSDDGRRRRTMSKTAAPAWRRPTCRARLRRSCRFAASSSGSRTR